MLQKTKSITVLCSVFAALSTLLFSCSLNNQSSELAATAGKCDEVAFNYENVSKWAAPNEDIPARNIMVCQIASLLKNGEAKLEDVALGYAQKAAMAWLSTTPIGAFASVMGGSDAGNASNILSQASLDAIKKIVNEAFEEKKRDEFYNKFNGYKENFKDYIYTGDDDEIRKLYIIALTGSGNDLLANSLMLESDYKMAKVFQLIASQSLTLYQEKARLVPGDRTLSVRAPEYVDRLNVMHETFISQNFDNVRKYVDTVGGSKGPFEGRSCEVRYTVVSQWSGQSHEYITRKGVDNCSLSPEQAAEYDLFLQNVIREEYKREFANFFGGRYNEILSNWSQTAGIPIPVAKCYDRLNKMNSPCPYLEDSPLAWQSLPGLASDIGVYDDSRVSVLGFGDGERNIFQWTGAGWMEVPGYARALDVGPDGIWVVNTAGSIYRNAGAGFYQLPGLAGDIGVGADGSAWVTSMNGDAIYRWSGSDWSQVPGAAKRISVGPDGNAIVVSNEGKIFKYNGASFIEMPGRATDVGVGGDGSIWIVGTDPNPYGFGIYSWSGSNWIKRVGGGTSIDVDNQGRPWVTNNAGNIFKASHK